MKLNYKGFVICRNNFNYHITIYKDNVLQMHFSFTHYVSDNDLYTIVESFLISE